MPTGTPSWRLDSRWRQHASWWLGLAAMFACGLAAAQGPVVIVDARVVWTDPVLADGGLVYGLEVEGEIHGSVGGSAIAARASANEGAVARYAAAVPASELLRLELRLGEDGLYELLSAYPVPISSRDGVDREATPPGALSLVQGNAADPPSGQKRAGVPRRIRSALEDTSFEQEVVELVNSERATFGGVERPPLKRVAPLNTSSEGHSSRMETQNFFSHCDLVDFSTHGTRMTAAGYIWNKASENIAAGQSTPNDVMYLPMFGWMDSEGHRNHILDTDVREVGVGYVFNNSDAAGVALNADLDCDGDSFSMFPLRHYWTQNFGRRNGVYPLVIDREASSTNDQTVDLYIYNASELGETTMTQMRFSNNDFDYSAWNPYDDAMVWMLSPGGGLKRVWVQLDSADAGSTPDFQTSDTIWFNASCSTTSFENEQLDGSPDTFQDCEIVAGPDVQVIGNTTLLADIVRLRDGFSVEDDAELRVRPQP